MSTIYPVILSGGSGTRLWPLSREMYPKQFIQFFKGDDTTLLGAALHRLPAADGFSEPILMCNNDHRFLIRKEAEEAGITPRAIVLEPSPRNTAPAIAIAALWTSRIDKNAIIAVMPSDHVIKDQAAFAQGVKAAAAIAAQRKLVLFGITPTGPHTGYGYIRRGAKLPGSVEAYDVASFFEKPDAARAAAYIADGQHFWNSGIFVLHAATFLEELGRLEPQVLEAAEQALDDAAKDLEFLRLDAKAYLASPSISVDHAVMERTSRAAMLPLSVGWSDAGSWSSLWEMSPHDKDDNAVQGDAILQDSSGCYVHASKSLVSTIGVKDLVIVETPDAVLVADKSRAQDVSKMVAELKRTNRSQHAQHLRNARPWGFFETLNVGPRFQVKLLHVKPGGRLSTQMHHHRSEHWVVVQGTALVVIDGVEQLVRENESVFITATQWHRLENPGKVPLELIEVQLGTYLGEDDIIRSDDVYHRAAEETR
ncbi:MAG: mannose-1-phosphate guanylyltransferase/mannose-6-phosphate isomerase [Hyphomicrobiaceae bacterium]|nr:mannose-1-phosphate guanylyltransferase/mannose-6-phosphate isomerase [Hyphomicrobiaceae bacterium]